MEAVLRGVAASCRRAVEGPCGWRQIEARRPGRAGARLARAGSLAPKPGSWTACDANARHTSSRAPELPPKRQLAHTLRHDLATRPGIKKLARWTSRPPRRLRQCSSCAGTWGCGARRPASAASRERQACSIAHGLREAGSHAQHHRSSQCGDQEAYQPECRAGPGNPPSEVR